MRNQIFLALLAVLVFSTTSFGQQLNPERSKIQWTANKVTGSHTGTLSISKGELSFNNQVLTGADFVIDMNTINTTDLTGEWKEKLDGHLKNEDFFDVKNFPTASFSATKIVSRGTPGDYKVIGIINIKGIKKEIKFNAHVDMDAKGLYTATAKLILDRTDYDIKYGSGSFFDDLGDKTIYDEFELDIVLASK